jgi:hypothetical protein
MTKENRRQREMDYYKGIPFNEEGEEVIEQCIYCKSRFLTIIKKLPVRFVVPIITHSQ